MTDAASAPATLTPETVAPDLSQLTKLLDNAGSKALNASRKHRNDLPVSQIVIDPVENYRWGSEAAMLRDLAALDANVDGTQVSSYELLKQSIASIGVQEPIAVVKRADGFHPIYGFTRAVAARELALTVIPAYVYDETIDAAELRLLQFRENSATLKRAVNWVAEVRLYHALVDQVAGHYRAMPAAERPRYPNGAAMTPKDAAGEAVGKVMGRNASTMRNRLFLLNNVPARVVALSEAGVLSYHAANEFHSGDANAPFTEEFLAKVLDRLLPDGKAEGVITPERVRIAFRELKDQGERPIQDGAILRTSGAVEFDRLSPGAARDLAADIARALIQALKLTNIADDAAIENTRRAADWYRIEGIGIGAGDIPSPLKATVDAKSRIAYDECRFRYCAAAIVTGFCFEALAKAGVEPNAWLSGMSKVDGRSVIHRVAFYAAVAKATRVSTPDEAKMPLGPRVRQAVAEVLALTGKR